jgi:predicted transcriptional regulator
MGRKGFIRSKIIEYLKSVDNEYVPQSTIHKLLGVSRSRVSEVLQRLEEEGIIVRRKLNNQYIVKLSEDVRTARQDTRTLSIGVVWSSEYPFLAPFAKRLKRRAGIKLRVAIYRSALDAVSDLVRGEMQLALAPLVTEIYFYATFKNVRVVGGGAYGGAAILENPKGSDDLVVSSYLSTMDVLRSVAVSSSEIDVSGTIYFKDPVKALSLAKRGRVKYFAVWHPLTKELMAYGFKPVARPEDYDLKYCCTLAVHAGLPADLIAIVKHEYEKALQDFIRNPTIWFDWYSQKVGIPVDVIREGWKSYKLNSVIDGNEIKKFLRLVGFRIPDPSSIAQLSM